MSLVGLTSAASLDNLVLPLTIGDIYLAQAGLSQGDGTNKLLVLSSGRHLYQMPYAANATTESMLYLS